MTIPANSIEKNYSNHCLGELHYRVLNKLPSSYVAPESIDAWRHYRMRKMILPLIASNPNTKWLTIGDGCFGDDANFLEKQGLDVVASSITDETLIIGHNLGFIKNFKQINAESINEADNSYDFVFCKEAYHHFPRPHVALYEMLRIAKKGIVFIEPQENKKRILDYFKKTIKRLVRKDLNDDFEPQTGNYIYRINLKEMTKVMQALDYKSVAYKRFNDLYIPSLSTKSAKKPGFAKIIMQLGISLQDLLCTIKLLDHGLISIILFKNDIDNQLQNSLKRRGFKIIYLKTNPFLDKE